MRIENNSSVYFNARLMNDNVCIYKKCVHPYYFREQASFVEVEKNNISDINSLKRAVYSWLPYDRFGKFICLCIDDKCKLGELNCNKVYALTSQQNEFDKLDNNKILGLVDIIEVDDAAYMPYIQVDPHMLYPSEPEYKGIGTAMIECLKNFYNRISCEPIDEDSVIRFFEKNGFVRKNFATYEWINPETG